MSNRNMAMSMINTLGTAKVVFIDKIDVNYDRLDPTFKRYTYAYDKSEMTLEVNQFVVVPGNGKLSVALVVEIDEYNDIDPAAGFNYALIICPVYLASYYKMLETISKTTKLLVEAERRTARANLVKEFTGNMSPEARALLNSGFSDLGIALEGEE